MKPSKRVKPGKPATTVKRSLAIVAIALVSASTLLAAAQPRRPSKKPPSVPSAAATEAGNGDAAQPVAPEPPSTARDAGKGGNVVDQKMADGGARVFRFGEVEVEGRLKSPQIVYFLRRVRAEFAAGDLGHRTFMRELGETKNEPSF